MWTKARRTLRATTAAALLALAVVPAAASAFDTGPHADMTRDALMAEGFTPSAADVGMIENWFVDYYTNPDKNPYSGHASSILGLTRLELDREDWLWQWVEGARRLHFDYNRRTLDMPDLSGPAGIEREWDRLEFHTRRILRHANEKDDPTFVMVALGASLHAVQDFYSHSNWVEDPSGEPGRGGPGIGQREFGTNPTWFDVPPDVRKTLEVYTGVPGIPRGHGHWASNDNNSLHDGLNKDWPGRPKFQEAYVTAYFATRQWTRAVRTWLGNEPLWKRAMAMGDSPSLRHDVKGATEVSEYSGHWQGGGEPCVPFSCGERTGKAGSASSLRLAVGEMHDRGPTSYRRAFNESIAQYALFPASKEIPEYPDLPTSRTYQLSTRFAKLEITSYAGGVSPLALGDPAGERADIYANAVLNGQSFFSGAIQGATSFSFPGVYAPFTWIKAVPAGNAQSTPVTSMTVRVETGGKAFAGTDDDVHLRIGPHRLPLDKRLYNDFERGDDDTYSVPIGELTKRGLTMADISSVAIEKSRDGVGGGWFLHGVTLTVNGRNVVRNRAIDRWLEKSNRTWVAPTIARDASTADVVGAWIELKDDDFGPDDQGDVNPYDRHTSLELAYRLGPTVRGASHGESRLRGRLPLDDGDNAALRWQLSTLNVTAPPIPVPDPQPQPEPQPEPGPGPQPGDDPKPGPGPKSDLILTSVNSTDVTVRNQGQGPAGAFTVTVEGLGSVRFPGLAAGASRTGTYRTNGACVGGRKVTVDVFGEVAESDETNNTGMLGDVIC